MTLIVDTIGKLRKMIDVLRSYCCKWNKLVNFIKTNKWYSEEVVFLRKMVYKGK